MPRGPSNRPPNPRRGGTRPGSGRRKIPVEHDPDRFFVTIWRVLVRLLGFGAYEAGYLAAHLLSAEPIVLSSVEGGVEEGALLIRASSAVPHHADTLETRVAGLVRKAELSSVVDPWVGRSEIAIVALIRAALALARPNLSEEARVWLSAAGETRVAELHELGWGEVLARLEARVAATFGSNLPSSDSPLARRGRGLLRAVRERQKR
jgi:hypothetical protein